MTPDQGPVPEHTHTSTASLVSVRRLCSSSFNIHVVIPMKDLAQAKSRLAAYLTAAKRRALALIMLRDVLASVAAYAAQGVTSSMLGVAVAAVWVVSRDPAVLAFAAHHGAHPLPDTTGSLNEALELSRTTVAAAGASALLVLPADVPLITMHDLERLIELMYSTQHSPHGVGASTAAVIAPNREGSGTNALGLTLPAVLPFQFGASSFARHLESARRLGLTIHQYHSPTLALDVDTPDDLQQVEHLLSPERRYIYDNYRLFRRA